jgi:hypothetical protein
LIDFRTQAATFPEMIGHAVRIFLGAVAGWLAWLWYVQLFAMGEASIVSPVSAQTRMMVWAILAGAAVVMYGIGLSSRSIPWVSCFAGAIYLLWRLADGYGELGPPASIAGSVFILFSLAAIAGSKSRRRFGLTNTLSHLP